LNFKIEYKGKMCKINDIVDEDAKGAVIYAKSTRILKLKKDTEKK